MNRDDSIAGPIQKLYLDGITCIYTTCGNELIADRFEIPDQFPRQMNKLAIIREFLQFLRESKAWWLVPIVFFLLLLGGLLVFANASPLAPFIYSFF